MQGLKGALWDLSPVKFKFIEANSNPGQSHGKSEHHHQASQIMHSREITQSKNSQDSSINQMMVNLVIKYYFQLNGGINL